MYEIIYYYFDYMIDMFNNEKLFDILFIKKGYFFEDYFKEFRVNKGVGMLFINKKVLKYVFSIYDDFEKMVSFFNVNDIVFKIRIFDELIYFYNLFYK